jgi:hypothetical protein
LTQCISEYHDAAGGFSSGDSLPGSPGDLVIAESGSEAEGRGRRATSAAPSTASDVSSASSKSKIRFDPTLPIYRKPFEFGKIILLFYENESKFQIYLQASKESLFIEVLLIRQKMQSRETYITFPRQGGNCVQQWMLQNTVE